MRRRTLSVRRPARCGDRLWLRIMSEAKRRPLSAGLRDYDGSEKSGLLARFTTRLLPVIRRSGPRRHITNPAAMCHPGVPQCNPPNPNPVSARQRPGRLPAARNDHARLSRQARAAEPAAAPEMSHREAAER